MRSLNRKVESKRLITKIQKIRTLLVLDPSRALALFSTDLPTISANFKMVDEMFVIRRTLASTLRKNKNETLKTGEAQIETEAESHFLASADLCGE